MPRPLSYGAFAAIVVAYLAIIQLGGTALENVGDHGDDVTTVEGVVWNMWLPLGAALVFTYAVIGVLGWWRPVFHEDRPVRPLAVVRARRLPGVQPGRDRLRRPG